MGLGVGNLGISDLGLPKAVLLPLVPLHFGFVNADSEAISQISQSQYCKSPPLDLVMEAGNFNLEKSTGSGNITSGSGLSLFLPIFLFSKFNSYCLQHEQIPFGNFKSDGS